jgi:hypothetical protein
VVECDAVISGCSAAEKEQKFYLHVILLHPNVTALHPNVTALHPNVTALHPNKFLYNTIN